MPIRTLNVSWSGLNCGASAVITLDTDLVEVLPQGLSHIAIDDIQELSVTVQGAAAGNGTFGKADFSSIIFYSRFPLDFNKPLIGQETDDPDAGLLAFGTMDAQGGGGDFNLTGVGSAPRGVYEFAMATNGTEEPADLLKLVSINP
jgi:hypothetical protein